MGIWTVMISRSKRLHLSQFVVSESGCRLFFVVHVGVIFVHRLKIQQDGTNVPGANVVPLASASLCVREQNFYYKLGLKFSRRDRSFILHMCIPCDKIFHMVP